MRFQSLENLLHLELPNIQKKKKNAMKIVICNFITCIWNNRENLEFIEEKFKAKIYNEKEFIKVMLKEKTKEIFCKKYYEMEKGNLNSMRKY